MIPIERLYNLVMKPHSDIDTLLDDYYNILREDEFEKLNVNDDVESMQNKNNTKTEEDEPSEDNNAQIDQSEAEDKEPVNTDTNNNISNKSASDIQPDNVPVPDEIQQTEPQHTKPEPDYELIKAKTHLVTNLEQLSRLSDILDKLISKDNDKQLLNLRIMVQKVLFNTTRSADMLINDKDKLQGVNKSIDEFIDAVVDEIQNYIKTKMNDNDKLEMTKQSNDKLDFFDIPNIISD